MAGCAAFNHTAQSVWPGVRAVSASPLPFVILFDGSSGSSWFADSLDRHQRVFIAGYEPLEWVTNASYTGTAARAWQPTWLSSVWQRPQGSWSSWLSLYHLNAKLDPSVHHAPLTVRMPTEHEVEGASAVGFKVRPATITENQLAGTLKHALSSLGGVVLVINRRSKLEQAVSLYRRRFEGKANQFGGGGQSTLTATTASSTHASGTPTHAGGGPDGPGGNPWATARIPSSHAASTAASVISTAEMSKLLDHRGAQEEAIECLVGLLDRPTLRVSYEDLQANYTATMRATLAHLGVTDDLDERSLAALYSASGEQGGGAAAGGGTSGGATGADVARAPSPPSFVKRSPSGLCASVANLVELCEHVS